MKFIISFTQDPSASVEEKLRTLRDSVQMALNTITNAEGSVTAGEVRWSDIKGRPTLAAVASTGNYEDLRNKPRFNGSYDDLNDKPVPTIRSDVRELDIAPGNTLVDSVELQSVEGYTPVAVAGFRLYGADVNLKSLMVIGNSLEIEAENPSDTNAQVQVTTNILYMKN